EGAAFAAVWAPRTLLLGVLAHSVHLVVASFVTQVCPVESLPFALSLSAVVTSIVYLVLRNRSQVQAIGVAVAPLALMFLVGAQFVGNSAASPEVPRTLLAFHVTANLLGLGLFLLAGAAGAFYLLQERRLKTKRRALAGG